MSGLKQTMRLLATGLVATVAAAAVTLPVLSVATAKEKPPQEWDGLVRQTSKKLDNVYIRPNVTFKAYKRLRLDPVEVKFDKNWDPNDGTRTLSKSNSACPCGASSYPKTGIIRRIVMPGVSIGTRIIDCCSWRGASGLVLPMKIAMRQRGSPAPEMNHFRPLITYASPLRTMLDRMFVASDEATSGSLIAKHERISPRRSGSSH